MFRNYFKIALRNLARHKFTSFINLFGLTLGLTCCLLITSFILNELSFDRYNKHADATYRLTRSFNNAEGVVSLNLSTVSPPIGYYLPTDFPDIKVMTRLLNNGSTAMRYEEKKFNENNVFFADEHLFDVFSVDVTKGNPANALANPFSVMLTEAVAKKYFGDEDPMGKTLRYYGQFDCKVTGIYKPFPANSHIHPAVLLSFNTLKDSTIYGENNLRTNWGNNSFFTYIVLPENYPVESMVKQLPAFVDRRMDHADYGGQLPSKFTKLGLQKMTDIHLYSHTDYEAEANGDMSRVYIFSAIAFFILLIACINYMNLSTARSTLRAREIGIRKVIGARRKELILQFLGESILVCLVATLLAIGAAFLMLPWLNRLTGQQLTFMSLMKWQVLVPLIFTPFVVGILAGIYPAIFLSSFQPVKTLKGLIRIGGRSVSFRKVLVVAQFAISIILIITTAIVFKQLHYMQRKSLGFDKERLVTMPYSPEIESHYDGFRNDLLAQAAFRSVTRSSRIPTGRLLDSQGASTYNGDSLVPVTTNITFVTTDHDFAGTFNIPMAAGRFYSRMYPTDTSAYVINESALAAVGARSAGDAVGRPFKYGNVSGHIIGVVKDFHFESMHQSIVPTVFILQPASNNSFNNISIKLANGDMHASLALLEQLWKRSYPETPFEYSFLDSRFDKLYESEQRQATLFTVFACVAIFIACLGLLGLSAFTISQRIKEIGVRKVLGANVGTIVRLLSVDFLRLVFVAALFAFPIAWYAMNSWLRDFAYRTNIAWWVFVLAGLIAALIAFATVSFQAIKAALTNPVKSLRSE